MKTHTILSAYLRARDMRFGVRSVHNPNSRARQLEVFREALLCRIEAGDLARDVLKEIKKGAGFDYDYEDIINLSEKALKIGKQNVS